MAEQKPFLQSDLFKREAATQVEFSSEWLSDLAANPPADPCGGIPGATLLYRLPVIALDFETTGLAVERGDAVCEVGLVRGIGDHVEVLISTLVNPGRPLSAATKRITGIEEKDLLDAPRFSEILPQILDLVGSSPLVIHNAPFDLHLLLRGVAEGNLPVMDNLAIDTLLLARFLGRNREGNSLRRAAEFCGIALGERHRAADDARSAALVYNALIPYLELRGVRTVGDLVRGRMAGAARLFVLRASSHLLDLAGRAVEAGTCLRMVYATRPGARPIVRKFRPRALEGDRYLIGWDFEVEAERTFRLDRILVMDDGKQAYVSPWATQEDIP